MPATAPPSFFHRLRHTPARDWLRGRLTASLDWRAMLAASELPQPVVECITRVVRRTRLWRTEQADVAAELLAHFRDGRAAGAAAETLIASFGDEKTAAKLIRRAKIRNRSTVWHAWRWLQRGVAGLFVLYAMLAARFFLSHPSPSIDYIAEMNRSILQTPLQDRAWPLYRQAMIGLNLVPVGHEVPPGFPEWVGSNVDSKQWPEMETWLRAHLRAMETLRQAASKPVLGFIFGRGGSIADAAIWSAETRAPFSISVSEDAMINLHMPYLTNCIYFSELLYADAKLAAADHDGDRVAQDINASLSIADHLRQGQPVLVCGFVALTVDRHALETLDRALTHDASLLTDASLRAIAARLAAFQCGADLITLAGEQNSFRDLVQRAYTDDGSGDGHLTADGLRALNSLLADFKRSGTDDPLVSNSKLATGPAMLLTLASRKDLLAQYDAVCERAEANLRHPIREVGPSAYSPTSGAFDDSMMATLRYGVATKFAPSFGHIQRNTEWFLGRLEGVEIGIALELFRREHGQWPQQLQELWPKYLPALPVDRINGEPLRYRLKDDQPLVYSVGADQVDDGGVAAKKDASKGPWSPYDVTADWFTTTPIAGDWILFPRPYPFDE